MPIVRDHSQARYFRILLPEVLAVEVEQIEGVEDDAIGLPPHSRLKRLEVGTAIAILDYSLTSIIADLQRRPAAARTMPG